MAFRELGLDEEEFYSTPPRKTYLMQQYVHRQIEREWEQTRAKMSMQFNTAMGNKKTLRPQDIIRLSFDEVEKHSWTQGEAEELILKWPDIKK